MILTCPSCETRFQIADGALGEAGRRVKCSACRHVWFQAPETTGESIPELNATPDVPLRPDDQDGPDAVSQEEDDVRPILPGAPTPISDKPSAVSDHVEVAAGETDDSQGEADYPTEPPEDGLDTDAKAAPDDAQETAKQGRRGRGWLLVVLLVVAALAALYQWRGEVMQAAPGFIPAYVAAGLIAPPSSRNLSLEDVGFEVLEEDGDKVLIVSGLVVNAGPGLSQLPKLRAELLDAEGQVTTFWTFPAKARVLAPGEQTGFRDIYPDPPVTGQETDIFVTFEDLR